MSEIATKPTCPHVESGIRAPNVHDQVHKTECTKCFDTDQGATGVDVCLTCFNGGCGGPKQHSQLHFSVSKHPVVCNIVRQDKPAVEKTPEELEAEKNPKKLEDILKEKPIEYDYKTQVRCLECKCNIPSSNSKVAPVIAALLKKDDASKAQEMKFEEKRTTCPHTEGLKQDPAAIKVKAKGQAHCKSCDINKDLWLCLTCGSLGCSRKIHSSLGGGGGNDHAVNHATTLAHQLAVKMGTITAEGSADIWCYGCDRNVLDAHFAHHLGHLGIDMSTQEKTSQTMAELELEKSLNFNWDAVIQDDGTEAQLAYGMGKTGLQNLGNTCYMSSVLQVLFSIPSFQRRYYGEGMQHLKDCRNSRPATCWGCQWAKLGEGLMSGRYSPAPSKEALELTLKAEERGEKKQKLEHKGSLQPGINPTMFRALVTKNSALFQTKEQQDAAEFFDYIMAQIKQNELKNGAQADPTGVFDFMLEERLQCLSCEKVKYTTNKTSQLRLEIPHAIVSGDKEKEKEYPDGPPVTLTNCLEKWAPGETIHGWNCPQCNKPCQAQKTNKFHTYPDILTVVLQRFVFDNWVPHKLRTEVNVESEIDMKTYRATGLLSGEQELPSASAAAAAAPAALSPDAGMLAQLMAMGFTENRCARALVAVANANADAAMNHVIMHLDDPSQDTPLAAAAPKKQADGPSQEAVDTLAAMGFEGERAVYALGQTNNDVGRAVEWLMSHMDDPLPSAAKEEKKGAPSIDTKPSNFRLVGIITHLGPSTARGHYVAYILKEGKWLKFNDSKVSVSENPKDRSQGYMLFFRRAG
eukprot:gb/GEZN01002176.1/.p1 GENE.gb/GEZN01002176.1/~~gb/GEZN01002176.1/.p1  ORF type:complete len:805 (-),score=133.63 gb/GEZN01002176.1/:141-2555(-)